jgi:hypothetical protein
MAADDFLYLNILGESNLLRNMDQLPDVVRALLLEKAQDWAEELESDVADNIQSRLKQKSGKLLRGLGHEVKVTGKMILARVFIRGVAYARPQEEGGQTPAHMIYPNKHRVLAFYGYEGKKVFATRVSHPGGHIPAHHFMKDAFRERGPEIARGTKKAVLDGIRAHMRRSA